MNVNETIQGVVIGVALSFCTSYIQWKIQSSYKNETEIKNKREELIIETADLFARAGRIKGLIHEETMQIVTNNSLSSLCISTLLQGKESKNCTTNIGYKTMNALNKEIFEYSARYQKLKALVPLYYCEATEKQFMKIEQEKGWWDITPKKVALILKTMHNEYECKY